MPEDKRTKLGPLAPARPATGAGPAPAASGTPVPGPPAPGGTAPAASLLGGPAVPNPPPIDPLLGQVIADRYLIQRKLGEGGMGGVYLATHNVLEKEVALKILHGEFARKPDLVERFMQEAKAASRIRHENVIDISDFGITADGMVFFAMELLTGHDLHEEVARARLAGQLLPWARSKRIFLQICAALGAAHALGIIHRDLKPENIYLVEFLGEPDFVKLLDFGIAKLTEVTDGDRKLTRTGMLFGTPEYMSPEQARGEPVDARVDVYAMGCILFQLVTGRVPFEADNFMGVLTQHVTQPPPAVPPEVFDSIGAPRALAQVIDQALAKDRDQRFASVDDLARAVRQVCGDRPTASPAAQDMRATNVPAANVAAPNVPLPNIPAPPAVAAIGRVKTQWTGNLSVPPAELAPARTSKLPLILGALALAGGAAVAALMLGSRGGASSADSSTAGSPAAAAPVTPSISPPLPSVPPPAPAPPRADAPLPFDRAQIRLDSTPTHAEVRDLSTGKLIGVTPLAFTLPSSRAPRQFGLHRKDYVDAVIEIVPEREKIEYTEKLERGTAAAPAIVHRATDPGHPAGAQAAPPPSVTPGGEPAGAEPPALKPEPTAPSSGEPARPEPPAARSPAPPSPSPSPSDSDAILLKPDPSRTGSGSSAP